MLLRMAEKSSFADGTPDGHVKLYRDLRKTYRVAEDHVTVEPNVVDKEKAQLRNQCAMLLCSYV